MPVNVKILAAAEDVLPGKSFGIDVFDRLLHDVRQIPVFAANVYVAALSAHGQPGDHHALDHRMRIMLKNQAILAGPRFALIPVAENIFGFGRLLGHK